MLLASHPRLSVVALSAALGVAACGDNRRPAAEDVDGAVVDGALVDAPIVDGAAVDSAVVDGAGVDGAGIDGAADGPALDSDPGDGAVPIDAAVDAAPPIDASTCTTTVAGFPLAPGVHVTQCSPITYATNPPTSGSHYPLWARFKTYTARVPRGFWVHDLEHGAVVITYNCIGGCAPELAALQAFLDARPADPLCVAPVRNRFIVTPDPLLDTRFAASAWGWSLRSDCFDLPALGAFIDAHYAQAPENFCSDGFDPTDPVSGVPATCP